MKNEEIDDELAALYQQRKMQIEVPKFNISALQCTGRKSTSMSRIFGILFTAGGASFAIFAIITHFATKTPNSKPAATVTQAITVEKLPPELNDTTKKNTYAVVIPPLPAPNKSVAKPLNRALVQPSEKLAEQTIALPKNYIQAVEVPAIKLPELALTPIFKVMPKYFINKYDKKKLGTIKLSYQIDNNGEIINIQVISSNVDRELKKSAKKALSQWKYKAADNYNNIYEIIFEFTQ